MCLHFGSTTEEKQSAGTSRGNEFIKEEWPVFHGPSAVPQGEQGPWVMPPGFKGRGGGLAINGMLPFILLSRAFDYFYLRPKLTHSSQVLSVKESLLRISSVQLVPHVCVCPKYGVTMH